MKFASSNLVNFVKEQIDSTLNITFWSPNSNFPSLQSNWCSVCFNPLRNRNMRKFMGRRLFPVAYATGNVLMASGWRRSLGNVRSFVGNSMGGLRGGSNLASWVVAGTLAYFLWVKPSQDLKREQEERAALAAASDPYRYVEKRKPVPDPQETGLIYGNKNRPTKSTNE